MHTAKNMAKCKKSRSKVLCEAYAEGYEMKLYTIENEHC